MWIVASFSYTSHYHMCMGARQTTWALTNLQVQLFQTEKAQWNVNLPFAELKGPDILFIPASGETPFTSNYIWESVKRLICLKLVVFEYVSFTQLT